MLRQILQIKSHYHRVINPTEAPCSNAYRLSFAYPFLPSILPFKLNTVAIYLGIPPLLSTSPPINQILSEPLALYSEQGHPKPATGLNLPLQKLFIKYQHIQQIHRLLVDLPILTTPTSPLLNFKNYSSSSMKNWYDATTQFNLLQPVANDRELWKILTPELK